MKLKLYLLGSTLVAAVAGFLFGFDTVVISGTTDMLKSYFHFDAPATSPVIDVLARCFHLTSSSIMLGLTVASAPIGTIVGSLLAGKPAERLGRKRVLIWLAVLYFVSALGCGLAWSWPALLAFRFIGGLAIGGASVVAPLYIAEISPPNIRGRLVAINQLNIVAGLVVAYFSNYAIAAWMPNDPSVWRWMFGMVAVPSAIFLLLVQPIPESPRWLVKRHRRDEALSVLRKLGNENAEGVMQEIVESLHEETVSADEPFFQRKYLLPIMLAFMVASFNQLSGINTILYYSKHIFIMAGAGQTSALAQSVIIGLTNLTFTLIGMSIIDHFGRRKLLITGAAGLTVCLSVTAWAFWMSDKITAGTLSHSYERAIGWTVLGSLIGFIAFFAFSSGAVIWVFISEIFPNRVRARGQALGSCTHWTWCALLTFAFPLIADYSKGAPFLFYAVMMLLQLVLVWKFLPETKRVSLEEMQRHLGIE
jgi:sugar porter (SP) family MFS transporter